jgi:RNA polymerase sigma-70 factor (ECF subfamily)
VPRFPPTRWSLIERLRGSGPEAEAALEELCAGYWRPLYCFIRQRGYAEAEAKDLTQDFLLNALRREVFQRAERERGRLRTFLLHACRHWLLNEQEKARAVVNGGACQFISRDEPALAERCYAACCEDETPESLYDRVWALQLLERVLSRLEKKWTDEGRREWFEVLRPFLDGGRNGEESYREAGARLQVSSELVRAAAFRLRRSYRKELLEEIRRTAPPEEEEEEVRWLIRAVARK